MRAPTMHLNLYGFRDGAWDVRHKRARRILFVGDSFVEGFMVGRRRRRFRRCSPGGRERMDNGRRSLQPRRRRHRSDRLHEAHPGRRADARAGRDRPGVLRQRFRRRARLSARSSIRPRSSRDGAPLAAADRAGPSDAYRAASRSRARGTLAEPFLAAVPDPSNPWTATGPRLRRASSRHRGRHAPRRRSIPMPSTSSPSTRTYFGASSTFRRI